MATIIDGKAVAQAMRAEMKQQVSDLPYEVGLAVVLVGHDGGSQVYVRNKIKACEELGIKSYAYYFEENVTTEELTDLIGVLNADPKVNGILVQLPLPKTIDESKILAMIDPIKDVDGFHATNVGQLVIGGKGLRPCTPSGIIRLIKSTGIEIAGKRAVVIGRSNIVGKPVALMLLAENATVTVAHSKTENLAAVAKQADILVVAIGKAKFVTKEFVKPGAVVIDVGTNRLDKLYGDVDFDDVVEVAGAITPVPGGVGPMTITMLMDNTIKAAALQHE